MANNGIWDIKIANDSRRTGFSGVSTRLFFDHHYVHGSYRRMKTKKMRQHFADENYKKLEVWGKCNR